MRRDWLEKIYPNGVGLGDLIRDYHDILHYVDELPTGSDAYVENCKRCDDLNALLNYMYKINYTPIFTDDERNPFE